MLWEEIMLLMQQLKVQLTLLIKLKQKLCLLEKKML